MSQNEIFKPIIAHLWATVGHQTPAKHGPCPTRASVFNYGIKEVSGDIREVTDRRQHPPNLFSKFIYLPLIHCTRTNLSTKPVDPREDTDGTKTEPMTQRYMSVLRAVCSSC